MPDVWDIVAAAGSGTGSRDKVRFWDIVAGAIGVAVGFGVAYGLALLLGDALSLVAAAALLLCAGVGFFAWRRFRKVPIGTAAGTFAIICLLWALMYGLAGS